MLRGFLFIATIGLVCPMVSAALIDFEDYADYQNLNGVNLGGVTLTSPSGIVEVFANNRQGTWYHSPVNSVSPDNWSNQPPMTGVFDEPQSFVSLWAGDEGNDTDQWELEAFDAPVGGNSLGVVTSPLWNGNPYERLSITAPNIWRFEARSVGPQYGVAFDDLEFIPEPAAFSLVALGGLLAAKRRR